jgi:hypothetical protein
LQPIARLNSTYHNTRKQQRRVDWTAYLLVLELEETHDRFNSTKKESRTKTFVRHFEDSTTSLLIWDPTSETRCVHLLYITVLLLLLCHPHNTHNKHKKKVSTAAQLHCWAAVGTPLTLAFNPGSIPGVSSSFFVHHAVWLKVHYNYYCGIKIDYPCSVIGGTLQLLLRDKKWIVV